ncbi:hypothetical protein ABGT15_04305 [Flavobacterium enshiense]|uniref:hypothetical protein n=1 Tax=Flavobacterium enshiense TaxID=1341165 RepID=UPI00345DA515
MKNIYPLIESIIKNGNLDRMTLMLNKLKKSVKLDDNFEYNISILSAAIREQKLNTILNKTNSPKSER